MTRLLPIFCHNMTVYQSVAKSLGYNRTKCAARARMSKGQWSDLLNGKISHPSIWTASRVADALRVKIDDLITFDEDMRQQAIARMVSLFALEQMQNKSAIAGVCGCVISNPNCHCNYFWHNQGTDYTDWNTAKDSRTMRVLDKTVQMNEDFKPVLLITLELPLEVNKGFQMHNGDFMAAFYEAIKLYEDQQTTKATGGE